MTSSASGRVGWSGAGGGILRRLREDAWGPSVRWRPGGQQLAGDLELLRFEVADINVVIKKACVDSLHYGDEVVASAGLAPGVGILAAVMLRGHRAVAGRATASGDQLPQVSRVGATALLDASYLVLTTAVFQDGLA